MWKIIILLSVLGVVKIQAQEFCVQCRSSENNFDCVYPDRLNSSQCAVNSGACFTRVLADGHIQRGCGADINSNECSNELCSRCSLVANSVAPCNNIVLPTDRLMCYICSGDRNSTCGRITDISNTEHKTICPVYRNDNQCVSTRIGNVVHRGCLSSMRDVNCASSHNCCLGHGCNHIEWDAVPGSAVTVHSVLNVAIMTFVGVIVGCKNL